MKSNFKIDNIEGATLGVCLLRNGCKDIFALPSLKNADITEWPDDDSLEVDYSTMTFNPRTITLTFIYERRDEIQPFLTKIGDGLPHAFEFTEYGMTIIMRLASRGGFSQFKKAGTFALTFVQDVIQPVPETTSTRLNSPIPRQGVALDGWDLSQLSIMVLDGTIQSLGAAAMPVVRQGVTIASRYTNGQTYLPQSIRHERLGDLTLQLLIHDKSLSSFKDAHQRLNFYMCSASTGKSTSPNRTIRFDGDAATYHYLYKSSSVEFLDKLTSGAFWLRMSVTLTLIGRE